MEVKKYNACNSYIFQGSHKQQVVLRQGCQGHIVLKNGFWKLNYLFGTKAKSKGTEGHWAPGNLMIVHNTILNF